MFPFLQVSEYLENRINKKNYREQWHSGRTFHLFLILYGCKHTFTIAGK